MYASAFAICALQLLVIAASALPTVTRLPKLTSRDDYYGNVRRMFIHAAVSR